MLYSAAKAIVILAFGISANRSHHINLKSTSFHQTQKKFINISDINKEDYKKSYNSFIIKNYNIIKKKGFIEIPTQKGHVIFRDKHPNSDNINSVEYSYIGFIKQIDIHIIQAKYFETGEYILTNAITGAKYKSWGRPIVSPNGKKILTVSSSLDYDVMPNGFQIFEIKDNKLIKSIEYTTDKWAPVEAFWANEKSIFIKRVIPEYLSISKKKETKYSKVEL